MAPFKVPVAGGFFPCAPLALADAGQFRAQGRRAAKDLVHASRLNTTRLDWTLHTNDGRVKVHKARKDGLPIYRAETEIHVTLDDLIAIFLTTSTADTREVNAIFSPDTIDKVRLYNLTLPTDAQPHFYQSISWSLLQTPLRGTGFKCRDWCYIEHMEELVIDGRRAWVRAFQHVNVDGCPDLQHPFGIVRGRILLSGVVFIESHVPGRVHVIELHHVRPNGNAVGLVGDLFLDNAASVRHQSLSTLETHVHAFKMSQLEFVPYASLVPPRARSACAVCLKTFGFFGFTKTNCRRCGDVVCGHTSCSAKWSLAGAKVPICRTCSDGCKHAPIAPRPRLPSMKPPPAPILGDNDEDDDDTSSNSAAHDVHGKRLPILGRDEDTSSSSSAIANRSQSQLVIPARASIEATLVSLLNHTTLMQRQLATQQTAIANTLGRHGHTIDTLTHTVARIEAKLDATDRLSYRET
ncbi:Aste57867_24583 [Aphanomyces stellatus]|uniref:Aste57867_24583 protein n=1 Tax=Aphanomyces stellatus TaxID=120398 RepID=A0A485LRH2_9STRA|nr:hypothetical protein As57867_024505 [Aphanomyces stellatus]VFU01222.1 Aste57867_24583 [Aphanomyces stellatus]